MTEFLGELDVTRGRNRARQERARRLDRAYWVAGGVLCVVFLVPLVWPVLRSFQPGVLTTAPPSGKYFTDLTTSNYTALFSGRSNVFRAFVNSAVVSIGTALLTAFLATLAGYGFGRFRFRGREVVFLLLLVTLMVPFQSILTPLFLELHYLHLTNNLPGLVIVYTTFDLPFGIFVMRNSFEKVPAEIEESARMDGASTSGLLVRVLRPLVMPGIATTALFCFFFSWTEFLAALTLLTSPNTFTLPIDLLNLETGTYGAVNYGLLEAGAVMAMIPCVVVYLLLQRYYVQGLMSGAVKN